MTDTVLVTGGTGFVAGWCIESLLRHGYRVRTTVRAAKGEDDVRSSIARAGHGDSQSRLSFARADLTSDEGWPEAMAGCRFVLHVASPLGGGNDHGRDALVGPARDGTLRVLGAAVAAGAERVVMTSAAATARPSLDVDAVSDETTWADPDDPQFDAYRRSKILAERAAWEFIERHGGATALTTVLPGAVFGPILSASRPGSVGIIHQLLNGQPAAMPRLGFWITDVRDLADAHVSAMERSAAAGERFLVAGEFLWMEDVASILRAGLGSRAQKVPSETLSLEASRELARENAQLRGLLPLLGRRNELTTEKARRVLGFSPRPASETIVECAESILALTEASR